MLNTLSALAGLPNTVRFNNNDIDNFYVLNILAQQYLSDTPTILY
jgi:hypothetical protein